MTGKVTDWFSVSEENRWFAHPTFLSAAALMVLVVVAAGVYTIAARATDVTRHAEATTALTETLRLSSAMRSDVSTVVVLDHAADAGIDIDVARQDVLASLSTGLEQMMVVQPDVEGLDSDASDSGISVALGDFVDATSALLDQQGNQASVDRFGEAHRALTSVVVPRRDELVDALQRDATAMNRTGSTTGYVVAFIVPALALYVFEALRRIRLRSVLTQQENAGLQSHAQASAALDASDLATLEHHAAALIAEARVDNPKHRAHLDGIRRSSAALRTRAIARGAALTTSLSPVDVGSALTTILDEAGLGHLEFVSSLEGDAALADAKNLRFALRELLTNALTHGEEPVRVKAYPWNDTITITISDRGPGLEPDIERAVFRSDLRTVRQDVAAAGGAAGLISVRSLVEAMGGGFEHERQDDTTFFVLRLQPTDIEQNSYRPAPAPV